MNIWQSKMKALFAAADAVDHRVQVRLVTPVQVQEYRMKTYRVVMVFGGETKRVGFNLTLRDAEIFAKAMPPKMRRVDDVAPDGDRFERAEYKIEEE